MIAWLKKNWLIVILLVVITYLLKNTLFPVNYYSTSSYGGGGLSFDSLGTSLKLSPQSAVRESYTPGLAYNSSPPSDSPDRIVIQDTSLSLVVKDVTQTIKDIESKTRGLGGFLINSNLNRPEQSASGTISVRVPHDRIPEALEAFKGYAVKVVSENVYGRDVTDRYEDLGAKLEILNKTKSKYEAILENAVAVSDLLNVQRELVNLQSQIDDLKGQQEFYKQSANLSRINIYLSTDELALPYTPDKAWRPSVIFKNSVRSLLGTFRSVGSAAIWLFVYTPIWVPILAVVYLVKRKKKTI
ncbi:MAG: DUF4349 domain-containing protein [Patescibacteria group bacterium]|jgi:hypothetical protein